MLLPALLLVVQAAAGDTVPTPGYTTPALRALLAEAARNNRLPPTLASYLAEVESEVAVIGLRDATEGAVSLEQVQSRLRWTRAGTYAQHVVGYRAQQVGLTVSMLSAFRTGWLTPTLYGNRMRLRSGHDSSGGAGRGGSRGRPSDTVTVVHPLSSDRDQYYTYSGGDTVVTLRAGGRAISIVRVQVEPRSGFTRRTGLFRGEIDLDADRRQIVRLRGTFLQLPEPRGVRVRLTQALARGFAYVEFVNAERLGEYWLPSYQRIELQATSVLMGDLRGVVRMVSRFADYRINDTTLGPADVAFADSLRADTTGRLRLRGPRRLTYATDDSLRRYDDWTQPLGAASSAVRAADFVDLGPEPQRPTGAPVVELRPERISDLVHLNRVEGLFTGVGARLRLRDAAPGVTLRAAAGHAWSERTVRGRLSVERARGPWTTAIRAARSLDLTNDFREPFDSGSTIAAIFSQDDYDYVDRRSLIATVSRRLRAGDVTWRLAAGPAADRPVTAHLTRGLVRADSAFRPNRGVDAGRYFHTAATLELHPGVNAEFLTPGVGARVHYERGDGGLDWQRVELRAVARGSWRALTTAARVDAGTLLAATPPPQQLFEIGEGQGLPGYDYKEFGGDRAAVARGLVMYTSPFLTAPIRLGRQWTLPGIAPGLSVGLQAGWADASDAAARASLLRLATATDGTPITPPRPTDGIRSSVNLGLRFFGGSVFLGVARPLDHAGPWKTILSLAQEL